MDEVIGFRRRAYAVGTVVSVGMGVAVALTAIPSPYVHLEYDATLVTGGIVGIVVTWAGVYAALAYKATHAALNYQRERDETTARRRRQALVLAMQVETEKLLDTITVLADQGNPLRGEHSLRHPVLSTALVSSELFEPLTVYQLSGVIQEVASLLAIIDHYWGEVDQWETRNNLGRSAAEPKHRPLEQNSIKMRSMMTVDQIQRLQQELINELRDEPLERPVPVLANGESFYAPGTLQVESSAALRSPDGHESNTPRRAGE
jgi:hypothetical protein